MSTSERPSLAEHSELAELRQANFDLQRRLLKAKVRVEALVEAAHAGALAAMVSLGGIPPVTPPPHDRRKTPREEVALWHLTDWQGSKVTPTYSTEVMERRVRQYLDTAVKITEQLRGLRPIRRCVILFGGDMVEGLFNFPSQPFAIDQTLFGQYVTVSRLMTEVVRRALSVYEQVHVVSEWGNHGRIGSRRAAVPRHDNVDRMCYELARQMLGEERLTWEDSQEDIQHVEIGRYRALLIHGDEIGRYGYASRNTIIQHANRWRSGAHSWEFRDVYVGHYHVHAEEPLANGEGSIYWTGSTESDNRYANDMLASSALPSQRLHFIDPEEGKVTSVWKVWLS